MAKPALRSPQGQPSSPVPPSRRHPSSVWATVIDTPTYTDLNPVLQSLEEDVAAVGSRLQAAAASSFLVIDAASGSRLRRLSGEQEVVPRHASARDQSPCR